MMFISIARTQNAAREIRLKSTPKHAHQTLRPTKTDYDRFNILYQS